MEQELQNITFSNQLTLNKCLEESQTKPLILIFSAQWLSSSSIVEIVSSKIARALPNANILNFDADENENLFVKYKIRKFPTCLLIVNEEIVSKFDGIFSKKNIVKMVQEYQ